MYDKKTNERAVRAYSNPAVGEFIPRRSSQRKKGVMEKVKAFFGL